MEDGQDQVGCGQVYALTIALGESLKNSPQRVVVSLQFSLGGSLDHPVVYDCGSVALPLSAGGVI